LIGGPPADTRRRYRGILPMAAGFAALLAAEPAGQLALAGWIPKALILVGVLLMFAGLLRYMTR